VTERAPQRKQGNDSLNNSFQVSQVAASTFKMNLLESYKTTTADRDSQSYKRFEEMSDMIQGHVKQQAS